LISGDEEKYHKTYCPDIKSRSYKGLASFDMLIKDNAKEYAGSQYVGSKYPELYSKLFLGCSLKNSSKENLNTFYESGTGHLLSISGLHIGAIALIIFLMVNSLCHIFLRGNRKYKIPYFYISIPLGFLFSLSYVLYIGVEIPRLRALIMLGLVMVGLFFSVFRRRLLVLAFTASVILIFIPGSVYSYSFYYSFASVLAILLLPNKKNIHLCTMIFAFLIPLNLHSNGSFNPMHIIANFVIVPIFSLFYFPLMLFFNLFTAYDWVLLLMDRITDLLLKLVNFFSILSQYTEYKTFTINTVEAGFLYILLIGFFIFFKYHKKNK
jgi:ComEC/Rec2-related protein